MEASSPVPPPLQAVAHDVEITIVSAKHLKNVNWRNGPLVPYAAVYLAPNPSPNLRFSTLPDDSNSTRPVWNERFLFPYSSFSSPDSILAVDVFHSRHSETPKPLVGSLQVTPASLLPDFPSSPWIIHSLDLLRPSGRPQGKLRVKVTLRQREIVPSPPAPFPTPDYNFSPGGANHYSSVSPGYYSACDYYPPPPPPTAHAFVRPFSQPLPRSPLSPPDYRAVPPPPARAYGNYHHDGSPLSPPDYRAVPPPPGRAYGNYHHDGSPLSPPDYRAVPPPPVRAYGNYHHDGNSDADSVYRPSAPVDFTYPAKECEPSNSVQPDFHCTTVSPLPHLSSSDITYTGTPPHWSSNRSVLWRNDLNSVSLKRDRWVAPSAPTGTLVYRHRRGLEEGSVAGAFGGLRLDEGNNAHRSNYAYSHGYGREE